MHNNVYRWEFDSATEFRKLILNIDNSIQKEVLKFKNWNGKVRVCSKCKTQLPETTYFFCSGGQKKYHRYCKVCEGSKYGWGRNKNYEFNKVGKHYCSKCDRVLPLNILYFSKATGRFNQKTGYSSNCKECLSVEASFGLYSINEYKLFFKIKTNYKVCHDCLLELPNTDDYFFKKNDRDNGACKCKKCMGFEYGIHRINIVMKDCTPEGFKYCVKCKILFKIDEIKYINHRYMCEKCYKELNRKNNGKPSTKARLRNHREIRRSLKKNLKADLTIEQWEETLKYFNHACAYCGMSEDEHYKINNQSLHQDHVIPISKNGEYTKSNIIPSCRTCNYSKNNKSLEDFFLYKDSFDENKYNKIIMFINIYDMQPFHEKTAEALEKNSNHVDALKKGLKRQGIDVE